MRINHPMFRAQRVKSCHECWLVCCCNPVKPFLAVGHGPDGLDVEILEALTHDIDGMVSQRCRLFREAINPHGQVSQQLFVLHVSNGAHLHHRGVFLVVPLLVQRQDPAHEVGSSHLAVSHAHIMPRCMSSSSLNIFSVGKRYGEPHLLLENLLLVLSICFVEHSSFCRHGRLGSVHFGILRRFDRDYNLDEIVKSLVERVHCELGAVGCG